MPESSDIPITIRGFEPHDLCACKKLYHEGLLGGMISENDTGLDIDDIISAYMDSPGNHFWVAVTDADTPEVVGMIGVQHYDEGCGEIRRLRVRRDVRRRGIGRKLFETALQWCQDRGYLKITLDTFHERDAAIQLFKKFNFVHSRTKEVHGKELLYFYLDIYGRDRADASQPE